MNKKEMLLRRVLPVLVLVIGGILAYALIATQPQPKKIAEKVPGLLVETVAVRKTSEQLNVIAQGTVIPARSVTIQPQVTGTILKVNPSLKPGGILRAGEPMVTIDPADFKLAVAQRETELNEARAQMALEQGRQTIAEDEWKVFKEEFGADVQKPDLALRKPQLASARAKVERAEAALQQAQLQLERTQINAPFHALVVEESAAEGQFVQPQQSIAQLVGADRFWVRASVPPDKIPFIDIPFNDNEKGSPAQVILDLGLEEVRFEGYVSRLEGRVDEQSRMAQLIITIPEPLGAFAQDPAQEESGLSSQKFPLLLNAYVDVVIQGAQSIEVFAVPRSALHEGNKVYVYEDGKSNGELRIRTLDIVWERQDEVLARAGLQEGDRLITSSIPAPVEGMRLRLAAAAEAPSK